MFFVLTVSCLSTPLRKCKGYRISITEKMKTNVTPTLSVDDLKLYLKNIDISKEQSKPCF